MKADWDDAPQHLYSPKKARSFGKWLGFGLLGVAITIALLYVTGTQFSLVRSPVPAENSEKPIEVSQNSFEFEEKDKGQSAAEEMFWANIKQKEAERRSQAKQTDYNDSNYTPRTPDNIVSMRGVRESSAYQNPVQRKNTSHKAIEKYRVWIKSWDGGTRYHAAWTVINNYIDGGSVCGNHRRGSIEYRECRKGAKQHFKNECRLWSDRWQSSREVRSDRMKQRYCSAADSFSPMG
ncbi:hypothetical protein BH591_27235 [Pseudomonas aeruginosa]|nr:hypothetical protein BH591_27235 [Pseudomonas aeruginosa]OKR24833.1 hypothetical protein BH593_27620 [Pseudomonas aeruginosa]SPY80129.1 Uncharacterised protein [Pseudomonas aeruginosa]